VYALVAAVVSLAFGAMVFTRIDERLASEL